MSDIVVWGFEQWLLLMLCPWRHCAPCSCLSSPVIACESCTHHERAIRRVWFCSMPTTKAATWMQVGAGPTAVGVPVTQAAADDVLTRCALQSSQSRHPNFALLAYGGYGGKQCNLPRSWIVLPQRLAVGGHRPCGRAAAAFRLLKEFSEKWRCILVHVTGGLVTTQSNQLVE